MRSSGKLANLVQFERMFMSCLGKWNPVLAIALLTYETDSKPEALLQSQKWQLINTS